MFDFIRSAPYSEWFFYSESVRALMRKLEPLKCMIGSEISLIYFSDHVKPENELGIKGKTLRKHPDEENKPSR